MKKLPIIDGLICFNSKILNKHPQCNLPLDAPKVQSGYIPESRLSINKWFAKL
jgi:hypothetical protein